MEFATKKPEQINDKVINVIDDFSLKGKYKIIGSNSLRSIQYGSDYDIKTSLKEITPTTIAKLLQKEYKKATKNPDIWIIDFKCGHDPRLVYKGDYSDHSIQKYLENPLIPAATKEKIKNSGGETRVELVRELFILRWKPRDIAAGKIKLIDGKTRSLAECVMDKTTMKIDLVTKVGNQFAEMSENYYISIGGKNNVAKEPSLKEFLDSLEEEIHYYSKWDSFKALKRLFSLLQAEGTKKNKNKLTKLIDFFNSQVGYLNKIRAELGILEKVLTSDKKPKWEDVVANLQFIKEQISQIYKIPLTESVFKNINSVTPTNVLSTVKTLKDYFLTKINNDSKDFLRYNI
jgi:uncharacterized protein YaaR (DUF327 family)